MLAHIDYVVRLLLCPHEHYRRIRAHELIDLRVLLVPVGGRLCFVLVRGSELPIALGPLDLVSKLCVALQGISMLHLGLFHPFCPQHEII